MLQSRPTRNNSSSLAFRTDQSTLKANMCLVLILELGHGSSSLVLEWLDIYEFVCSLSADFKNEVSTQCRFMKPTSSDGETAHKHRERGVIRRRADTVTWLNNKYRGHLLLQVKNLAKCILGTCRVAHSALPPLPETLRPGHDAHC